MTKIPMAERQTERVQRERSGGQYSGGGSRGSYARQWSGAGRRKKYLKPPAYTSLDEVPADIMQRGLTEKLPWIQKFINSGYPRGKLKEYARDYALSLDIDPADVPPYTTLNTWAHRYREFGLLGLMDGVRADAGASRTVPPQVGDVAKIFRVGGKMGPSDILTALHEHFDTDKIPEYDALRRFIRKYERDNPHLMVLADEGFAGWRNKFRLALAGTNWPGGFVYAVDSTVADIWVRVRDQSAPEGWRAVRLVLTVIEDVGSRLLVTFNLSFKAVDAGILKGVFRKAVVQDANHDGLLSPGLPRSVLLDEGAEHQGQFREMLDLYSVGILGGAGYHPERNGREERLIQTLQREVFGALLGYSKTHQRFDPYARPDKELTRRLTDLKYDPYRLEVPVMALQEVQELEAKIIGWGQNYNAWTHSGLPADSKELMAIAAKAAEFDGVEEVARV